MVANGRPYKPTTKCSRCDGKRPEPEQQQQQRDDEEPEYQGSDDDSRSSRDTAGGGGLELDDADAVTEEDKDVNGDDDLDSDDDDIVQQERMPRNRLKIGVPLVVAISLLLMATVSIRHSQDSEYCVWIRTFKIFQIFTPYSYPFPQLSFECQRLLHRQCFKFVQRPKST